MDAARLQNRRKHIIKLNVMLQMRIKTRIEERKKSDLYLPTIVKVHFKSFNCKTGQQKSSNFETGRIGSYGSFEGDFIFKNKKILVRSKKSKLIYFKLEKIEN